jgi:ribosomal protein S18 acetylase RimI-like enzyme
MPVEVSTPGDADLTELADVAARTFPLACPPSATADNIAAFIAENLTQTRFAEYLTAPDRAVLVGRVRGRIVGYAILIRGIGDNADVARAVTVQPAVELSKMYVLPDAHGAGVSTALMTTALHRARGLDAAAVWLGVNQQNQRAQRFYAKHGFVVTGTKTFQLGEGVESDYVMVCPL